MRISLQLVGHDEGGEPATITEIAQFERGGLDVGSLGLHLEEAKSLLGGCSGLWSRHRLPRPLPGPAFVPRAVHSWLAG